MYESMNSCAQSSSPISPLTTGTCLATTPIVESQHGSDAHTLASDTWTEAASWAAGSRGRHWSQPERSVAQATPPATSSCVAPVERTAFTSCCMPAVFQPSEVRQPSRQQRHEMPCGSLYRSKSTAGSLRKAVATERQKAGE